MFYSVCVCVCVRWCCLVTLFGVDDDSVEDSGWCSRGRLRYRESPPWARLAALDCLQLGAFASRPLFLFFSKKKIKKCCIGSKSNKKC